MSLAVNPPDAVNSLLVGALAHKIEHTRVSLPLVIHLALHRCQGGLESACFACPASLCVGALTLPVPRAEAYLPKRHQGLCRTRSSGQPTQEVYLEGTSGREGRQVGWDSGDDQAVAICVVGSPVQREAGALPGNEGVPGPGVVKDECKAPLHRI